MSGYGGDSLFWQSEFSQVFQNWFMPSKFVVSVNTLDLMKQKNINSVAIVALIENLLMHF